MAEQPVPTGLQQHSLASVFLAFLRLGVTAFGGPAMVAYIRKMAVERKHWLDGEIFDDGVALCQAIPGATAMQVAAYTGLRIRGIGGALAAYVGFGLPAFLLMMVLSALYVSTSELPPVKALFLALQAIVVAMLAYATVSFGKTSLKHWIHVLIAGIAAVLFIANVHPVIVIALSALLGILLLPNPDKKQDIPVTKASFTGKIFSYFALRCVSFFCITLFPAERTFCTCFNDGMD